MPMVTVKAAFDCKHTSTVDIDVDSDVRLPDQVRGLGKCSDCMEETNLIAISGVQPAADGSLALDSVFWMPVEGQ